MTSDVSRYIGHFKNIYNVHNTLIVDDDEHIKQLLWLAEIGTPSEFLDQLSWMAIESYGKEVPVVFVFPDSLTMKQIDMIFKMNIKGRTRSMTVNMIFHFFVIKF